MIEEQKQTATNPAEEQELNPTSEVTTETASDIGSPEVLESQELSPESDGGGTQQASESAATSESQSNIDEENAEIISVLQQENVNLRKMLDGKIEENKGVKAQYARLAADFDNFRKRTGKEKESLEQQARKKVISDLLPVVDNFERARVQIKPASDGEKTIHNSYQGVYKTLVDCLKKMGVAAMRPEGQEFDPNFHEAMLREQTNEYDEGIVIEQLMRGYTLGEEVLRHAMVKVAVPAEPEEIVEERAEETGNSEDDTDSSS